MIGGGVEFAAQGALEPESVRCLQGKAQAALNNGINWEVISELKQELLGEVFHAGPPESGVELKVGKCASEYFGGYFLSFEGCGRNEESGSEIVNQPWYAARMFMYVIDNVRVKEPVCSADAF